MLIIFTTVPDTALGETLAEGLVREKLAACVQIFPQMTSVYFWEGQMQKDSEHLLLIKTSDDMFEKVRDHITANHPYTTPEIVAIEADKVAEPYGRWVEGNVGGK